MHNQLFCLFLDNLLFWALNEMEILSHIIEILLDLHCSYLLIFLFPIQLLSSLLLYQPLLVKILLFENFGLEIYWLNLFLLPRSQFPRNIVQIVIDLYSFILMNIVYKLYHLAFHDFLLWKDKSVQKVNIIFFLLLDSFLWLIELTIWVLFHWF